MTYLFDIYHRYTFQHMCNDTYIGVCTKTGIAPFDKNNRMCRIPREECGQYVSAQYNQLYGHHCLISRGPLGITEDNAIVQYVRYNPSHKLMDVLHFIDEYTGIRASHLFGY